MNKLSDLVINTERTDNISILKYCGDINLNTLKIAKTALKKEIASGFKLCVIDLDEVNYMDSSGIGFILGSLKEIKNEDGHLRISRLNAYLSGLFRLLNLNEIMEISDSIESAVSSLKRLNK